MRIEDDVKLDYSDVLIRPKRSTLASRKEVDLNRTYTFKHSSHKWTGIPIMASNMDGVGTMDMARALYEHRLFTCLVKNYDVNDFDEFIYDLKWMLKNSTGLPIVFDYRTNNLNKIKE